MVLTGHRGGLWHIVRRYRDGYSPEMLVGQYSTLPLALVQKVIFFYLEHQAEVDAYLADYHADLDRHVRLQPAAVDVAALRQRLAALQRRELASRPDERRMALAFVLLNWLQRTAALLAARAINQF